MRSIGPAYENARGPYFVDSLTGGIVHVAAIS